MTEEIIIDGVNVAECEFYFQDEKYSCDLSFINKEELCKCDDVQDCTYKQLKRLEQENKELKADLKQYDVWLREERQDNAELATDNFKLRTTLEEIRGKVNQSYQMADRHIVLNIINEVLND